ncbi:DoxX family membrane protein [Sphingobium nicotianae]|uniref:DoxX family membrane protein n=1 Tax=Sphingobium nicotianae TaxID=2782607 RepID=A0A9X1DDJ1_9SPHN|nr:DoxX family membrane protein [Sphingobium nicotianae]MBT2188230.1 DoxX family membrane protein [Sphingobium nicotianae]
MKLAYTIVRLIFGAWFTYAGIEYFLPNLQPFGTTAIAQQFTHALVDSGLMLIVKLMELAAGVLILANRAVLPAALAILPISVVIAFWNIVLDPAPPVGYAFGVVTPLFNLILLWPYRERLGTLLVWKPAQA